MPVILFDIDGTLVRTAGAGKAAMEAGLAAAFGVMEIRGEVSYSGRTDTAIARDLLTMHGIEPTPENQHRLREAYLVNLPGNLRSKGGSICPGVAELLTIISGDQEAVIGLLTGNIRRGAMHKLGHFGLWDYFTCGGFGDQHYDRDDVARAAVRSVREYLGAEVNPTNVWVVGDTPLDVSCARAIGAKAVAVATGWHVHDELAECKPDLLLDDLSDYARLLSMMK